MHFTRELDNNPTRPHLCHQICLSPLLHLAQAWCYKSSSASASLEALWIVYDSNEDPNTWNSPIMWWKLVTFVFSQVSMSPLKETNEKIQIFPRAWNDHTCSRHLRKPHGSILHTVTSLQLVWTTNFDFTNGPPYCGPRKVQFFG
jgi:hypothetical protein